MKQLEDSMENMKTQDRKNNILFKEVIVGKYNKPEFQKKD